MCNCREQETFKVIIISWDVEHRRRPARSIPDSRQRAFKYVCLPPEYVDDLFLGNSRALTSVGYLLARNLGSHSLARNATLYAHLSVSLLVNPIMATELALSTASLQVHYNIDFHCATALLPKLLLALLERMLRHEVQTP